MIRKRRMAPVPAFPRLTAGPASHVQTGMAQVAPGGIPTRVGTDLKGSNGRWGFRFNGARPESLQAQPPAQQRALLGRTGLAFAALDLQAQRDPRADRQTTAQAPASRVPVGQRQTDIGRDQTMPAERAETIADLRVQTRRPVVVVVRRALGASAKRGRFPPPSAPATDRRSASDRPSPCRRPSRRRRRHGAPPVPTWASAAPPRPARDRRSPPGPDAGAGRLRPPPSDPARPPTRSTWRRRPP